MKVALSLTRRYLLFLAVVVVSLLAASYLITEAVVGNGLTHLFEQRLQRCRVVLDQYASVHLMTRAKEIDAVVSSPRFLAAVDTRDAATIQAELPLYSDMLGADLFVVSDPRGTLLYADSTVDAVTRHSLQTLLRREPVSQGVHYLRVGDLYTEVFVATVETQDGFSLGRVAAGTPFSTLVLNDLRRLTGFDVVIADGFEVVGHTHGRAVEAMIESGEIVNSLNDLGRLRRIEVDGSNIMSLALRDDHFNAAIVFMGSPDEWLAPIESKISLFLILLATVGGLVAMATIYAVTERRIGRQVTLLVEAAEKIADGDLSSAIQPISQDELGYLAREFEKMRGRLVEQRKQLETEHEARLRSERMATIGRLATGIVHDFKNPMTIIRGNVDLIEMKQSGSSDIARHYRVIKNQIERMGQLARDILEFTKGRVNLQREHVHVRTYMAEVAAGQAAAYDGAGVQLQLDGPLDVHACFDPHRFRRVLDNLLSNACEVLHSGGRVVVQWKVEEGALVISLADNGPGIPADICDTLFEPFVTHGKKQGTGLGLSIAQKIVGDHGGSLTVESDPSWGTRFKICLPDVDPDPVPQVTT